MPTTANATALPSVFELHQDAAGFARANQQIVGPAQVDGESGWRRESHRQPRARGQRQQRQARGGNLRAQQHADVEPLAGGRVPAVIAAAAAGPLLIGKVDGAVRRAAAGGGQRVGVGGIGDAQKNAACRQRWCRQARLRAQPDRTLPGSLRGDGHGDVGGLGRVGERAHADEVHAGLGIGANVFKHDAARGFGGNPAFGLPPVSFRMRSTECFTCFGRHVVEQDGLGAIVERFFELLRRAHFHLHALARLAPLEGARAATVRRPPPSEM